MTTQTTQTTMISSSDLEQKATQQDDLYVSLKKTNLVGEIPDV